MKTIHISLCVGIALLASSLSSDATGAQVPQGKKKGASAAAAEPSRNQGDPEKTYKPASEFVDREMIWTVLVGYRVRIETERETIEGILSSFDDSYVLIIGSDGELLTVPRHHVIKVVRTHERPAVAESGTPAQTAAEKPEAEKADKDKDTEDDREDEAEDEDEEGEDDGPAEPEDKWPGESKEKGFLIGGFTGPGILGPLVDYRYQNFNMYASFGLALFLITGSFDDPWAPSVLAAGGSWQIKDTYWRFEWHGAVSVVGRRRYLDEEQEGGEREHYVTMLFGTNIGFTYDRPDGLTLGFRIPIFGAGFNTNGEPPMGTEDYVASYMIVYYVSAMAMPVFFLGYRF
jgi:hypothetical protein